MPDITPGNETTEFRTKQQANWVTWFALALSALSAIGDVVMQALGHDSKWGMILGGILGTVAIIHKTVVDKVYINSRTDVKVSAAKNGHGS